MKKLVVLVTYCAVACHTLPVIAARVWTDSRGAYTLEADLVMFNDATVILQRGDHELVAIPIDALSEEDRDYLESSDAISAAKQTSEAAQTWVLNNGVEVTGRIVDYTARDVTLQRRRRRIYVNDRVLENLPTFYQELVPAIVAHVEQLPQADRRSLEAWLVRQRAQPRTFHLEGVILETENGDEYAIPFFLFNDDDLKLLHPGWDDWEAAWGRDDVNAAHEWAFLLESLAAARYHDRRVQREIAMLQLKLQAVDVGLTSLWEVTLYPLPGQHLPPQWVVVPGRDSRQATDTALQMNPGFAAGPVRRVSR
ncbi:MAG: SHD1 domain-containing protein [Pirellulales bacterium]